LTPPPKPKEKIFSLIDAFASVARPKFTRAQLEQIFKSDFTCPCSELELRCQTCKYHNTRTGGSCTEGALFEHLLETVYHKRVKGFCDLNKPRWERVVKMVLLLEIREYPVGTNHLSGFSRPEYSKFRG